MSDSALAVLPAIRGFSNSGGVPMALVRQKRVRFQRRTVSHGFEYSGNCLAVVVLALMQGRAGRTLLKRLTVLSALSIHKSLAVLEIVIAVVVLAHVAARAFSAVTSKVERSISSSPGAPRSGARHDRESKNLQAAGQEAECIIVEFPNSEKSLGVPEGFHERLRERNLRLAEVRAEEEDQFPMPPTRGPGLIAYLPANIGGIGNIRPVVLHFQLPISCNCLGVTFWDNIVITLKPPRASSSNGVQVHMNKSSSLETRGTITSTQSPIEYTCGCRSSSHEVTKRRQFKCTLINGQLSVMKNTFHTGDRQKVSINDEPLILENSRRTDLQGLNFKFCTRVMESQTIFNPSTSTEVPVTRRWYNHGKRIPTSTLTFKQQAVFELLPSTLLIQDQHDYWSDIRREDEESNRSNRSTAIINFLNIAKKVRNRQAAQLFEEQCQLRWNMDTSYSLKIKNVPESERANMPTYATTTTSYLLP